MKPKNFKFRNLFFCCFFLLISMLSFGQNKKSDEMILTDDGVILNLKGTFKISWDRSDPNVPCSSPGYGQMLFYPNNKAIVNGKAIILLLRDFDFYNWDKNKDYDKEFDEEEKAKVEILKKTFPEEFEKMEKIKKGKMQSPVKVIIKKVTPYTECDFTTVYAQVTDIKKIDGAKSKITKLKVKKKSDESDDFDEPYLDELPYVKLYEVSTKDGYANIREKPSTNSKIVTRLENKKILKYIMADGDWYYVYINEHSTNPDEDYKVTEFWGFVHKSQLKWKKAYYEMNDDEKALLEIK